ncbi:hypothetical protein [Chryseobacterium gambrini]|uniref:hypothetical protein n=1 Tax=Chryseobacterium gambrini TaxID=373672 RepID=UPI003D0D641F
MDLQERQEVYSAAIEKWGSTAQIEMLQEESTELALAARKFMRKGNPETYNSLIGELADVEIMIEQMKLMFPSAETEINLQKDFKINRLKGRIETNTFTE